MNGDENGELPEGWTWAKLNTVAHPSSEKVEPDGFCDAPYLSLEHIEAHTNQIIGQGRGADVRSTKAVFCVGSVLYGKLRPYLNKVAIPDFSGICSTDILVFPKSPVIENRLLLYFLSRCEVVAFAHHNSSGVQLPRISFKELGTLDVPLPPQAEQRRIVAAVEAVLARVNAARDRLNLVPAILKRFRQSVLAAACSGRLTADWREKNNSLTPSDWIQRIFDLRQQSESGRKLLKLGTPRIEQLPNSGIPGWRVTRVGDIAECLDNVRVPIKKELRGDGSIPYYGANGRTGWIDKYLFDEDLVLVVEDESFLGRTTAFSYVIRGKSWVNNHAHVLRPLGGMVADYLNILLAFYDFVPLTSGTTGRRKLNQAELIAAPISVAPLPEQQEIVRRVDALFALADRIETKLTAARQRVESLTQAILAKAFRGELVPTEAELARRENRTYESAADLLARIRAEREQSAAPAKPKRGRRANT